VDPKDVYGEDFPGETFRVKEKEIMQYGDGYAVGRDGWRNVEKCWRRK